MADACEPPPLVPADLLAIDGLLSEEERAVRDAVRRFVRDRVVHDVGEWFETGGLPNDVIEGLAELGLFGMHLHGYGCAGASAR